jgi:predicted dehydrogenase
MKEVAARQRVATQMGNQGSSTDGLRTGVEVLRAGALGPVSEIHLWTNRPIWPQGDAALQARMRGNTTVPASLDWDVWLGPAPQRAYNSAYLPFSWRGWWDYGTGALGDMGCHTMNLVFRGLRLTAPSTVEANLETPPAHADTAPVGCTITYEFPAIEGRPALKLYWYERRRPPQNILAHLGDRQPSGSGCIVIGQRGQLYSPNDYGERWELLPQTTYQNYQMPERTLPRVGGGHHREWINACKGGPAAFSNFIDHASLLTEILLLGNVAIRVGQKFTWDSTNLRATDCTAAAQYVRRQYRQGWDLRT